MHPRHTSILFVLLTVFAWQNKLVLDTILLGILAFLSYMNHSKLIPFPILFHVLDKLYAHFFAITYAITSIWYGYTTRNGLFFFSLINGLVSSAIYLFHLLPQVCVHIGAFLAGVVYILAMAKQMQMQKRMQKQKQTSNANKANANTNVDAKSNMNANVDVKANTNVDAKANTNVTAIVTAKSNMNANVDAKANMNANVDAKANTNVDAKSNVNAIVTAKSMANAKAIHSCSL